MNLILNILAGAFAQAGTEAVVTVLQKLHDSDQKMYTVALLGGRLLTTSLDPVVDKTKTKIDDSFVDAIGNAVEISAERNDIDLTIFDAFIQDAAEKLG